MKARSGRHVSAVHPELSVRFQAVTVMEAYELVEALGGTEASWASANDEDIDVASGFKLC